MRHSYWPRSGDTRGTLGDGIKLAACTPGSHSVFCCCLFCPCLFFYFTIDHSFHCRWHQTLDLSKNQIAQLPLSFRCMLRLERLILSQNCLSSISGEEFTASLTCLDVSHNCLTTLDYFAECLGRRCFQLETLNLSFNKLDSETTTMLEQTVVPKWALQMKWLRQVEWIPQHQKKSTTNG